MKQILKVSLHLIDGGEITNKFTLNNDDTLEIEDFIRTIENVKFFSFFPENGDEEYYPISSVSKIILRVIS